MKKMDVKYGFPESLKIISYGITGRPVIEHGRNFYSVFNKGDLTQIVQGYLWRKMAWFIWHKYMRIFHVKAKKEIADQQHPFFSFFKSPLPKAKLWVRSGTCLISNSFIIRARVMKLSSTFMLFLTEVERYLILWEPHHSMTSASLTLLSRSFLLPSSMITALSALVLQRSYHCSLIFLNDFSLERSNTIKTPWHPLK